MSKMLELPTTAEDLIKLGRTSNVEDIPKDQAAALFDVDGTLTEPGSELLIANFLSEVHIGSERIRKELMKRFEKWAEARLDGDPDYETYLEDVGILWAQMLHRDDRGRRIKRGEVLTAAETWFTETGQRDIMPHSLKVLDMVRDLKFRPVLVTGAPMELAVFYAKALGVGHLFAMDAEVDQSQQYTKKMRFRENTGIGTNKGRICTELERYNLPIGFAMGDTKSDFVLFDYAVNPKHENDMKGAAALINPSKSVLSAFYADSAMRNHKRLRKIGIHERGDDEDAIVDYSRFLIERQLRKNDMEDGSDLKMAA